MNQKIEIPQTVDLGLSSKWASFNIGAKTPEDYGQYFAWGEIAPKENYDKEGYKWFSDETTSRYGAIGDSIIDNPSIHLILDLGDDAARLLLGGGWRMPNLKDIFELYDKCDWTWTSLNGINGCKITSMVRGYTGFSIFLPATGFICKSQKINLGLSGYYWSSAVYQNNARDAITTFFDSNRRYKYIPHPRYMGVCIRPVCD